MRDSQSGEPSSSTWGTSNSVSSGTVDITVHRGEVHFYTITEAQLDSLSSGSWQIYTSLSCAFFGFFGSLLSIFLAGFTSPSPIHTTVTSAVTMASGALFVFFGVMALFAYRTHTRNIWQIKERRFLV